MLEDDDGPVAHHAADLEVERGGRPGGDRAGVDLEVLGRGLALVPLVDSVSAMPRPAASWRTTLPQAMVRTPGGSSSGTSSRARPKPMMSKRTMGWLYVA